MQFKSLKTILDKNKFLKKNFEKLKKTGVSSREFFYFFKNLFKLSNYSAMVLRPIWVQIFFTLSLIILKTLSGQNFNKGFNSKNF